MEARRQQILDAAATCFTRSGFHPTSIQDICTEAGTSTGGLYRHFESKRAIIEALFARGDSTNRALLGDPPVGACAEEASLSAVLASGLRQVGSADARSTLRLSLAMHAEAARDEGIADLLAGHLDQVSASFRAKIRSAQAQGTLPPDLDPDATAAIVVALFEGLKAQLAIDPCLDVDRYASTVQSLLFRS